MQRRLWHIGAFSLAPQILFAAGCGYTLRFQPAQVINEPLTKEDGTLPPGAQGMPLEIDIVCLDHDDAETYSKITTATAKEWFGEYGKNGLRDTDAQQLRADGRIYSLSDDKKLKGWKGVCLVGNQPQSVSGVHHPEPFNGKSQMLIFAKFYGTELDPKGMRQVLAVPPVKLNPPSRYDPKITIGVDARHIVAVTKPSL
ncbi:MAG: hypothetical protein HY718_21070 [Planctomycetes bacterium]|nr:hypothetical protein [Planctomycetota bacterium]